jgi:CRP-like cAMP-binding protein
MIDKVLMETMQSFESRPEIIYKPGDAIFTEGEQGDCMFGLISGEVEFQVGGVVIEVMQPGEIFGIGAIVQSDHLRASSAIAKTECRIAELDRSHFLFAVQQTPMFALEAMRVYSNRYRRLKVLYKQALQD